MDVFDRFKEEIEKFTGIEYPEKILIIEYDPITDVSDIEPLPIMCGECWLNSGSPKCKCLTNKP